MKFLFLVGVEGTGHSMIRAVLKEHFGRENFVDEGAWHRPLITHWDYTGPYDRDLRGRLSRIFNQYESTNATHLFDSSSFPFNQPRDTLRRPDIIELVKLLDGLVDCRMLVLYRNPVSATFSGLRRGFTVNILQQAKITEDNFIFIERQLSQCDRKSYRVLVFEDFLADPESYISGLAEWWDLDEDMLRRDLTNLKQPALMKDIPLPALEILTDFFDERRVNQWIRFYRDDRRMKYAQQGKLVTRFPKPE